MLEIVDRDRIMIACPRPGRVRKRLAAMLCKSLPRGLDVAAVEVDPHHLWSSRSPERRWDDALGTWGGTGYATDFNGARLRFSFGAYATMTECVRGVDGYWQGARFCSGVFVFPRAAVEVDRG